MDVKQSEIHKGDSLPITDRVYRHGISDWVEKKKEENRYIPNLHFFDLSDTDKKTGYNLSVEWEKNTTPEETIRRIGCSYKQETEVFKNYDNRVIYAIDINFLNSLDEIIDTIYDPILHTLKKIGYMDNIAHSLINFDKDQYEQNRPALLTEIRNHAKNKKVDINMSEVDKLVNECREQ